VRLVWFERIAIALASVALASFLIVLVSGYFSGHDVGQLTGGPGAGVRYRDQGDRLLSPGELRPPYDSVPPTSGPHVPDPVTRDGAALSDNQILQALSVGDVVFLYGSRRPARWLQALAARLAGPFTPSLAASGLAVVLARRRGTVGVTALAWTRMLALRGAAHPDVRPADASLLSEFTHDWLGRGAR
jgi:hypothetical protein